MKTQIELPASIQNLIQRLKDLKPEAILLFGSRARGDFRENSDFDIAVKCKHLDKNKWQQILFWLDEEPSTLFKVDLVHFEKLQIEFQNKINKEGIAL